MSFGSRTKARAIATRWRCPPGQLAGKVPSTLGKTHAFQHAQRSLPPSPAAHPGFQVQAHFDVFHSGKRVEQIVGLKNVPDAAPYLRQRAPRRSAQFLPKDPQAPCLHGAQGTDQGQQGGLPGTGRPGHDHDLARVYRSGDSEQDLLAQSTATYKVIHLAYDDGLRGHGLPPPQKMSAGSAARTLRTATNPETIHIAIVSSSTPIPTSHPKCIGSLVARSVKAYN